MQAAKIVFRYDDDLAWLWISYLVVETGFLDLHVVGGFLYIDWRGGSINDGKRSLRVYALQDFAGTLYDTVLI
jgi:hypothetical protein